MPQLNNYSKRVLFPQGRQKAYLERVRSKLQLPYVELAKIASVSARSLNDWRREKYSIPQDVLIILSSRAEIKIPKGISIREPFWYVTKGASLGGKAVHKKYGPIIGNQEYRKRRWYEWWESKGRYTSPIIGITKSFISPGFSEKVAEFVGIMMGDGGITKSQISITLHSRQDLEYMRFVKQLLEELFGVPVAVFRCKNQNANRLVLSRSGIVKCCHEKLGLPVGNKIKQNLDIPIWIKENSEFKKACLRGLMDTDGCIFQETHHIKNKTYSYPRLNFTTASFFLQQSVFTILKEFGFNPTSRRGGRSIQIEEKGEICEYFRIVGTSNPKHAERFKKLLR